MALNNQSGRLADLGRREQALAAINEAVEVYQQLAEARPDAFLPDLARSLLVRGMVFSQMGNLADALSSLSEGLTICLDRQQEDLLEIAVSLLRTLRQQATNLFDTQWRDAFG